MWHGHTVFLAIYKGAVKSTLELVTETLLETQCKDKEGWLDQLGDCDLFKYGGVGYKTNCFQVYGLKQYLAISWNSAGCLASAGQFCRFHWGPHTAAFIWSLASAGMPQMAPHPVFLST